MQRPILAMMYDFDHTLSPREMQEYAFIPALGMAPEAFWARFRQTALAHGMDDILAYMLLMLELSRGKQLVTRDTLTALGKSVAFFDGVETWFDRVNDYARRCGLAAEHYIISSGLREIIQGTAIAGAFKRIYAASFCYDDAGVPYWPAMAVNYTSKTQFLFRINKGMLDAAENRGLNEYMPEDQRRVPFRNMIYIGDGPTDVPCMKLTRVNGGHSVAVYQDDRRDADRMVLDGRVDFAAPADYRPGSELERAVFEIIDQVAATEKTVRRRIVCRARAQDAFREEF